VGWEIKGYIVDDATSLAISPESTEVRFDSLGLKIDKKGAFIYKTFSGGAHQLEIRKPGFKPFSQRLFLDKKDIQPFFVFRLRPTNPRAKRRELYVTAQSIPLHLRAELGGETLTREDIHRSTGISTDPVRALQNLPGVAATADLNARPVVRGGDILEIRGNLDGIPLIQPYHFGGFKSVFNTNSIERITLYRTNIPASRHNALSGAINVIPRKPFGKEAFDLVFDLNMLQYSGYTQFPIAPGKLGLNLSVQGSYFNWTKDKMIGVFGEKDEEVTQIQEIFQIPDYQDFSLGLVYQFTDQSRIFISEMNSSDKYRFINPDSLYLFNLKFKDTAYTKTTRFYHEIERGFTDENGNWVTDYEAVVLEKDLVLDTQFVYGSNYNLLYGQWEHFAGLNHVFKTTVAWQYRRWDLEFFNKLFGLSEDQEYDVRLNQYNYQTQWLYGGKKNHLVTSGVQIDHTQQRYNVNLERILHEFIVRGSTNFGDYWGPISGDSGVTAVVLFGPNGLFAEYQPLSGKTGRIDPNLLVSFEGEKRYTNYSVHLNDQWDINKKLTVSLGARGERAGLDKFFTFSPRTTAKFQLTRKHELLAALGNFTQNDYEFAEIALSKNLRPEGSWHYNLGWHYEITPWLTQKVSAYYKRYYDLVSESLVPQNLTKTDVISYIVGEIDTTLAIVDVDAVKKRVDSIEIADPELYGRMLTLAAIGKKLTFQTQFNNSGSGEAFGLEYFLKYRPAPGWGGSLSLTFGISERVRQEGFKSHPFPLERPFLLSYFHFFKIQRNYEVSFRYRYMSGKPYTKAEWQDQLPTVGPYNNERLAAFSRLDFRISKYFKFFGHKGEWYSELWNALNSPNHLERDVKTGHIKTFNINWPFPVLFTGVKFTW